MRRQRLLRVRMSSEELDRLDRIAGSRGVTRSELVRSLIVEAQPLQDLLAEIPEFEDQAFVAEWARRYPMTWR
jgi:hypothetical protein